MDQDDKSFRENFETLLALFKKLSDKMSQGEIEGMNPELAGQFNKMLSQYDMMKNMMPHDVPGKFREPFRQMMENMIRQLRDELGDEFVISAEIKEDREQTIDEIEELLRRPGLDPADMDRLLDRLAELKSKKG